VHLWFEAGLFHIKYMAAAAAAAIGIAVIVATGVRGIGIVERQPLHPSCRTFRLRTGHIARLA
jgi:hypothetical protein